MSAQNHNQREHHWDALRALLMLLGLPYHVALAYHIGSGTGQAWIVNAHEGVPCFAQLAQFIHFFRMPAFFMIAGYFTALLLARRAPAIWLQGRFKRLGIPLLVTLITLNPLLNMACELSNFPLDGAIRSWLHNSSKSGGYWVRHLWFLIVLLYYSLAAAALVSWFPGLRGRQVSSAKDSWLAAHFTLFWFALAAIVAVWEAVSIELFYMGGLATNVPQQIFRLDETLKYLPYFLIGAVLARMPLTRAKLYRLSPAITMAGVVFAGLALLYAKGLWPPYGRLLSTMAALCLTQPVLAVLRHIADTPSAAVRQVVDASFVIYLFHLPILCWLVIAFVPVAMPVVVKALLVLLLTFALSWVAWEVVSRSAVLRLLYDGISAKAQSGANSVRMRDQSTQSSPMSR
ncbi:MAG: acyltransferase family protein [Sphingobium sp.]|nr:acyltransferase family protein [Sphingobium sp.]MCP5399104.1 acyltransferase family protein [Sphingomonas sp.]